MGPFGPGAIIVAASWAMGRQKTPTRRDGWIQPPTGRVFSAGVSILSRSKRTDRFGVGETVLAASWASGPLHALTGQRESFRTRIGCWSLVTAPRPSSPL